MKKRWYFFAEKSGTIKFNDSVNLNVHRENEFGEREL